MASPLFLMWYDDNPKTTTALKVEAAMAAYANRFGGVKPNIVLCNEAETLEVQGAEVRGLASIGKNNFWVGYERREGDRTVAPTDHRAQRIRSR